MTVKELLDELKRCPQDADIIIGSGDQYANKGRFCGVYYTNDGNEVVYLDSGGDGGLYVQIDGGTLDQPMLVWEKRS